MPAVTQGPTDQRSPGTGLARGTSTTLYYVVTDQDSVRGLAHRSPEFAAKPDIVASARLLELCEWPCIELLRSAMKPQQCSLGVRQYLDHRGPIVIGARLEITATCTAADRSRSRWQVTVHDGHDIVGTAALAFVVVDQADFERTRMAPKARR